MKPGLSLPAIGIFFALAGGWLPGAASRSLASAIIVDDPQTESAPALRLAPAEVAKVATLGSVDSETPFKMQVELSGWGASILNIRLTDYMTEARGETPYLIQSATPLPEPEQHRFIYPFAARSVTINDQKLSLADARWELIEPDQYRTTLEPPPNQPRQRVFTRAVYALTVVDDAGEPALEIRRAYSLSPDDYELRCSQRFINHTDEPLSVVWSQYAQGDAPDDADYLGDRRMLMAGYRDLEYDPDGEIVFSKNAYVSRQDVLNGKPFWPNDSLPEQRQLVWVASLNRYFAMSVHAGIAGRATVSDRSHVPGLDTIFPKLGIETLGRSADGKAATLALSLTSRPLEIAPDATGQLDVSLYTGPRKSEIFETEPYQSLGFGKLIIYELGCALCTFQPLAKGLLSFLKFLHGITFDWAVSIIILVLVVRLILHPITKKSQINMMKMGKQMQALQPELEKLKKKYADDQQRYQQEQVKLFREKNINPANMLGCLPMFLQTPIWIALYAMLYYAIELRHQQAFYGFFQAISGGHWAFLGDLSSPDQFIRFSGEGFTLPLYFINPKFSGINIIPLLMAGVFLIQQKLTTPPPANEQAAQQQKIMKFTVLLFPIFLYSAPCGLTLYILASTFAGIVDGYVVRRHIKREEEAGTLFDDKRKPPKPGGFRDRMQKALEAKQRQMMEQRGGGKASGGSGQRNRPKRRKGR